jgi:hypothetical protein
LPDNCTRDAGDIDRPDDSYPDGPPALLGLSGDGGGPTYHQDYIPVIEGLARFQVADDAPMKVSPPSDDWCPDVKSTLPLSRPRGPISSTTNTLRVAGTATENKCLFFADDADLRPEPNPCAARPPSALAAEVTQRMAEGYQCAKDKKVWPPPQEGYCFEQPGYCIPRPDETFETCNGGQSISMKTGTIIVLLYIVGMFLL